MAPTPAQGARLSPAKVTSPLRRHHIRAVTPDEVVAKSRAKALPVAPGLVAAASAHVPLLLPLIRVNRQRLGECTDQIEALLTRLATPTPEAEGDESTAETKKTAS